ncbi:hypothetical protein [Amycolatopsis jejuensis]|uniref:hypothetical protein n=1 Tax=Amycolatopsis jejuensis TaxID=330084 RepID=UPI000527C056|nr:hypothetical protein [Amycolatopsis jejuensis]
MSVSRAGYRSVVVAASVVLAAVLPSGAPAFASSRVCTQYFCNDTMGDAEYFGYVKASKLATMQVGGGYIYGFFEVFSGKDKWAGPRTTSQSTTIDPPGSYHVKKGGLVCLRFFHRVGTGWQELGPPACTTSPF